MTMRAKVVNLGNLTGDVLEVEQDVYNPNTGQEERRVASVRRGDTLDVGVGHVNSDAGPDDGWRTVRLRARPSSGEAVGQPQLLVTDPPRDG